MRARTSRRSTTGSRAARGGAARGADRRSRGARGRAPGPRRVDRPDAPALLRLRRLVGPRDRRARRPPCLVLRRQPGGVGGGGDGDRGSGDPLGRRVRRLPAEAGAFTSGGTVSNMTALAAARERAIPGRAATASGALRRRSTARGGALLDRTCGRDPRDRLGQRAVAADRRRPASAARGGREAIRADRAAGRVPVAVIATAGTTLTGAVDPIGALADVCAEQESGCTSTAPTGFPPPPRPPPATSSAGSIASTRSRSTPTSGSTCRRPAASSSSAAGTISSRRSRTRRRTSRTSAPGTWSTSRSSTPALSGR